MKLYFTIISLFFIFFSNPLHPDVNDNINTEDKTTFSEVESAKTYYGVASYYADKFNGRKTANGEIYDSKKLTAACNVLPFGTWIRITNLSNNKSIIAKINDRLHPKMKRIVDVSKSGASTLGYVGKGLTKVKVEVLNAKTKK